MERVPLKCENIDKILDGGVERGTITLLYGEAGSGKTNICLQLARNVRREGRKVVFIDTEGVSLERLKQMCGDRNDYEEVIKGILFTEPYSFEEQEEMIEKVARLMDGDANIGMIILDSATLHYRLTLPHVEKSERKSLTKQIIVLLKIARRKNIPVVITSQVYTDTEKGTFEPLGGHTLFHNTKAIIYLQKAGSSKRRAVVIKHRHLAEGVCAEFKLTERGVE